MNMRTALMVAAMLTTALAAAPATAEEVITNPGKCAQYYPNANCQNYGPGNPYRGPYSYQHGWRGGYAWYHSGGRRHHYRY